MTRKRRLNRPQPDLLAAPSNEDRSHAAHLRWRRLVNAQQDRLSRCRPGRDDHQIHMAAALLSVLGH